MSSQEEKPKKKKGPIRTEAVVPVAILITLMSLYYKFFFDGHLKKVIEFAGTQIHGAEVNIDEIKTSLFGGLFEMHNLQVTDKKKPEQNIVQIGEIKFHLLMDALLRAKMVVEEASIKNILAYAPRKTAGKIIPKDQDEEENVVTQSAKKVQDAAVSQTKEQFNDNVMGDVAHVLSGTDPADQLKNIQANLKTDAKIKEVEKIIKEKEVQWQKRLKELPRPKEFDQLVAKAKKIKFDNNPLTALKSLKALNALKKEAEGKVKTFKETGNKIKSDVKSIDGFKRDIEQFIEKDIADLQKRLKIPKLDTASFSAGLFGKLFETKVDEIKKYMGQAQKYMPPPKKPGDEAPPIAPKKRKKGANISFPKEKGYPQFWLKKSTISSVPTDSPYSGKIEGTITDVTTEPALLGKPAIARVKGDFPHQKIYGLDAKVKIDHTTASPKETLHARLASYPISGQKLSSGEDLNFAISKAQGQIDLRASLSNQILNVNIVNYFKNVGYQIEAKNKYVKEMLTNIVNDIPTINVKARASGSWDFLNWNIRSNLGEELGKGLKKQLKAKVDEARNKLRNYVNSQVGGNKQKLEQKMNKVKSKIDGLLNKQSGQFEKAKKKAVGQISGHRKGQKNAPKKQLQKAKDKLKKLFKF